MSSLPRSSEGIMVDWIQASPLALASAVGLAQEFCHNTTNDSSPVTDGSFTCTVCTTSLETRTRTPSSRLGLSVSICAHSATRLQLQGIQNIARMQHRGYDDRSEYLNGRRQLQPYLPHGPSRSYRWKSCVVPVCSEGYLDSLAIRLSGRDGESVTRAVLALFIL